MPLRETKRGVLPCISHRFQKKFMFWIFLVACTRLYNSLCPLVDWSVGWSHFTFFMILFFWPHCSCPNGLVTSNNRVCKIIRNCFMERKLYLKVTQHYEILTRVPQLVMLEARIDCRYFLSPLSLLGSNDLKQRSWFWQDFISLAKKVIKS